MQFHQLKRNTPNRKRMIVARGGKRGKTSGRGGKGQSARAGNKRRPEWRDIIKKLPKLRGRGVNSNKSINDAFFPVNLAVIEANFDAKSNITPTTLVEKGILSTYSGKIPAVKILGEGEVTKSFTVSGCYISGSAKEKIEKAGGKVEVIVPKVIVKEKKAKKTEAKAEAKAEEPKVEKTKAKKSADKPKKATSKSAK